MERVEAPRYPKNTTTARLQALVDGLGPSWVSRELLQRVANQQDGRKSSVPRAGLKPDVLGKA